MGATLIEGLSEEKVLLGSVVTELCLTCCLSEVDWSTPVGLWDEGEGLRVIATMLRLRVACSGVKSFSVSFCCERREWVELRDSVSALRLRRCWCCECGLASSVGGGCACVLAVSPAVLWWYVFLVPPENLTSVPSTSRIMHGTVNLSVKGVLC